MLPLDIKKNVAMDFELNVGFCSIVQHWHSFLANGLHAHTHAHSQDCTWESLQVTHPCDSLTVSLSHQSSSTVNESCTNPATHALQSQAALSLSHIICTTHTLTHRTTYNVVGLILHALVQESSLSGPAGGQRTVSSQRNRFPGESQQVFWRRNAYF